jgi:DNA-binding MarR family transcriptional regulator
MAHMAAQKRTERGGLKESPSHLLHRAQQFAAERFSQDYNGPDALTLRQYAVLKALSAANGQTQTDLVKATGVDRSTLAEMIKRLEMKRLVARERAEDDARANAVSITAGGKALLSSVTARVSKADSAILAVVPKAQQKAFIATLQKIAEAADEAQYADEPAPRRAPAAPRAAAKPRRAAAAKGRAAKTPAKAPAKAARRGR